MIYADHAATTRVCKEALDAMLPLFDGIYANPSSLHTAGQQAADAVRAARASMAEAFACRPEELIFTSGGTEADNQALRTAAYIGAKAGKHHLLSTAIEHHAVLHTLKALEKEGFTVELLEPGQDGIVSADAVRDALRPDTALVSMMYANNEIGTLQPVAEVGALTRARGILFHCDAVQAVGHVPICPEALGIDMLSMSAHKFGGPKGVGALYMRRGVRAAVLLEGGEQERGRRGGTENVPGIAGMAAALRAGLANTEAVNARVQAMRDRLIDGVLARVPYAALNGDRTKRLPGNASFCFEGIEGESLILWLDAYGICASSGSACASGSLEPSHVLLAIGRPHEIAHGSLRLTLGADNDDADVDTLLEFIPQTVEKLRALSPVWHDLQSGKRVHLLA